jgi:hypothetical protein
MHRSFTSELRCKFQFGKVIPEVAQSSIIVGKNFDHFAGGCLFDAFFGQDEGSGTKLSSGIYLFHIPCCFFNLSDFR